MGFVTAQSSLGKTVAEHGCFYLKSSSNYGKRCLILLTSPSCWFFLLMIFLTCSPLNRSSVSVTPKYLKELTYSSGLGFIQITEPVPDDFTQRLLPNRKIFDSKQLRVRRFYCSQSEADSSLLRPGSDAELFMSRT